jgi:hypothetical protein
VPAQYKASTDLHVVLGAGDTRQVVCWRTTIKVASFAAKGNPSPDMNVEARAEIEDAAGKLSGCRIGLTIKLCCTLLIVAIAAPTTAYGDIADVGKNFSRTPGVTYKLAKFLVAELIFEETSRCGLAKKSTSP